MKTRAEVEALKVSWASDPTWGLEDTEGFEEYHDELEAYSDWANHIWENRRLEEIRAKADQLHIWGNLALAEYIIGLETRLLEVERRLNGWAD